MGRFDYNKFSTDPRLSVYLEELQKSIASGNLLHPRAYLEMLGVKFSPSPRGVEDEARKAIESFDKRFNRELGDSRGSGFGDPSLPYDPEDRDRYMKMMRVYLAARGFK